MRRLRIDEEKKEARKKKKPQEENIMACPALNREAAAGHIGAQRSIFPRQIN